MNHNNYIPLAEFINAIHETTEGEEGKKQTTYTLYRIQQIVWSYFFYELIQHDFKDFF